MFSTLSYDPLGYILYIYIYYDKMGKEESILWKVNRKDRHLWGVNALMVGLIFCHEGSEVFICICTLIEGKYDKKMEAEQLKFYIFKNYKGE